MLLNLARDNLVKKTEAIVNDQEDQKEVYEFFEEDDDMEEFEKNYEDKIGLPLGKSICGGGNMCLGQEAKFRVI